MQPITYPHRPDFARRSAIAPRSGRYAIEGKTRAPIEELRLTEMYLVRLSTRKIGIGRVHLVLPPPHTQQPRLGYPRCRIERAGKRVASTDIPVVLARRRLHQSLARRA